LSSRLRKLKFYLGRGYSSNNVHPEWRIVSIDVPIRIYDKSFIVHPKYDFLFVHFYTSTGRQSTSFGINTRGNFEFLIINRKENIMYIYTRTIFMRVLHMYYLVLLCIHNNVAMYIINSNEWLTYYIYSFVLFSWFSFSNIRRRKYVFDLVSR